MLVIQLDEKRTMALNMGALSPDEAFTAPILINRPSHTRAVESSLLGIPSPLTMQEQGKNI